VLTLPWVTLQVKGVILDPSCSGSGTTVSRMDHLLPGSSSTAGAASELDEQEQQRVEQLAKFQVRFSGTVNSVESTAQR
jgi:putative methyltransferase